MSGAAGRVTLAVAVACGLAPGSGAATQGGLARSRTAQLGAARAGIDAQVADVNGDGRPDLVVAARAEADPGARSLEVFLAEGEGALVPGQRLDLTPDVVSWAVGDVHPDAGDEVILFNGGGAFVWRTGAAAEARFVRLLEADFLWQLPSSSGLFQWQSGVIDLDADGLVDLVVPEPDGYRIAFQRRSETDVSFADPSVIAVPIELTSEGAWVSAHPDQTGWRGSRSRGELGFALSVRAGADDDYQLPTTLLAVVESTPAPQLLDWDADGDLDLMAQTASRLHVWTQERGAFSGDRRSSYPLPVPADRDRRLDASYSSHALDLDGDARADCVIFAGDRRSDDVRTQSLVFVQGAGTGESAQTEGAPLFGPRGRPQDLLVFAGFVATVRFVDVDVDGLPDMTVAAVRPDLIDQLRAVSSESIDTDLFVYLNRKGRFTRRPDLTFRMALPLERFHAMARFVGDVTGNGFSELLVRDTPDRVRLLMVRQVRGQETLEVVGKPLWETEVEERARLQFLETPGRDVKDLLVVEKHRVTHVRFR